MVISSVSVTEASEPQKPQLDVHFCIVSINSMSLLNGFIIV